MRRNDSSNGPTTRRLRGEGRFCRTCHYPLNGLESPGACPEFGCDFDFTLLYSYAVDPAPTLLQRLISRRRIAFVLALLLEALMLWVVHIHGPLVRRDPAWYVLFGLTFTIVWLLMFASGLDVACDEAWHFVLAGILFGLLAFLPVGWMDGWLKLIVGMCWGTMTGLFLLSLKRHGWVG